MNSTSVAVSCAQPTANATTELKRYPARARLPGGDVLNSYKRRLYPRDRGIASRSLLFPRALMRGYPYNGFLRRHRAARPQHSFLNPQIDLIRQLASP